MSPPYILLDNKVLLPRVERREVSAVTYSELFNLTGLPDPDEAERLFQIGIDNGCFTINEIRERRGLPPREDGDVPFIPNREPDEPIIVHSGGSS